MKKRLFLVAGIMSITPGLASSDYIDLVTKYPAHYHVFALAGAASHGHDLTGLASLEAFHMDGIANLPAAQDPASRLRLAAWLLGPSIIAMVTIARRRDINIKPE